MYMYVMCTYDRANSVDELTPWNATCCMSSSSSSSIVESTCLHHDSTFV